MNGQGCSPAPAMEPDYKTAQEHASVCQMLEQLESSTAQAISEFRLIEQQLGLVPPPTNATPSTQPCAGIRPRLGEIAMRVRVLADCLTEMRSAV